MAGLYDDARTVYAPTPDGLAFLDASPMVEPGDLIMELRGLLREAAESCATGNPSIAKSLEPKAALFALWCRVKETGIDPTPVTELVREAMAFVRPSLRYGTPTTNRSEPINRLAFAFDLLQQADEWALAHRLKMETEASNTMRSNNKDEVKHSTDFRSVRWFGTVYSFTVNQAPVVRMLYEHWQAGTPDVSDETLLSSVDPEAPPARLSTLFRDHPAWGKMIVPGGSKGTHQLTTREKENL